jgi:hypothetical protein
MFDNQAERFLFTFKSERGSAESILVLIPVLLLFLGVLQIGSVGYFRAVTNNENQSRVAKLGLFRDGLILHESSFLPRNAADDFKMESLPGGDRIIVLRTKNEASKISGLIRTITSQDITTVAFDENE